MKMSNRIIPAFISFVILCALAPIEARASEIPSRFEFRGSGYGHGVGMSQIGAYGQALEGRTASEIVSYYYPGTSVAVVDDSQFVRVNIADKVTAVSFSVEGITGVAAPMRIYSGDLSPEVPASEPAVAEIAGGSELNFSTLSGTMIATTIDGTTKAATALPASQLFTIRWSGTAVYPGETNLVKMRQGSVLRRYKYGQIQVRFLPPVTPAIQGSIIATTTLRIHGEYLRGIGEVPSSWPSAALEAQAIAARSFAIVKSNTYRKGCDCNLYSSVQDQNFVGYSKESEPVYGQRWVDAVSATEPEPGKGLAVTYNGKVISTFYASSTGGTTQDVSEVWGTAIAYLVPVPDPWSLDPTINPSFSSWTRQVSQSDFAKAFGLPDVVRYEITARTKAGGVKAIVATSSSGKSAELTGEVFRSRVKLPSTWISRSVNRVIADGADELAVAVSRNIWPSAKSAVLVNFQKDPANALVGVAYGNKRQLPVLNLSSSGLSAVTLKELARRKITSVILIGNSKALPGKSAITKARLSERRLTGRSEIEVSEKVFAELQGAPLVLISSEREQMFGDAARILAANRPIVWSRDYEPSSNLSSILALRGGESIFYGQVSEFRFPTRIVITRSQLAAFIGSGWHSPILIADGSELEQAQNLITSYPNIASITVVDKELELKPFQELN